MAERLTPGVYVEERPGGARPIQGVATSTAGFVGEAERGIPSRATFCRNVGDYERRFGGMRRGSAGHLAAAVRGFFDAGGRRAYVVRVLPASATAGASEDVLARGPDVWGIDRPVLRVRARGNGAWASSLRVHVEPATAFPEDAFRLRIEVAENGRVRTIETFDNVRMDSGHEDYVVTVVDDTSQYVEVDDLFRQTFLDAEQREAPPIPETVAALESVEPTGEGDRFAVPRRAVLVLRWSDLLSQTGSQGWDGEGTAVRFDDEATPGEVSDDDVLLTSQELVDWLSDRLGDDFRVTGGRTSPRLRSTDGPWDTTGGDRSVLRLDGTDHEVVYTVLSAAALDLGAGPFNLNDGDEIEILVNGQAQRHTLAAGEVTAGAATAAEVAAVLNRNFTGVQAFVEGGTLRLRTDTRGAAATLAVAGATAAAFGSPAAAQGAGNVADPAAVTAAELAAAVDALRLPLRVDVDGDAVVVSVSDLSAPHSLDWVSDPGDDILAATPAIDSPVPGGPIRVEPAVASRAYLVAAVPASTVNLAATDEIRLVATSGPLTRTFTVDPATFPSRDAVPLTDLAAALQAAVEAAEGGQPDPLGVAVEVAGTHLVATAPARRGGVTLELQTDGDEPWSAAPRGVPGQGGVVVDDQRGVTITVSEQLRAGVARALPRLFATARAAGRKENDPATPALRPAGTGDRPLRLLGGSDGTGTPGVGEYTEALRAFDRVDLGLLAAPGKTDGAFVAALSGYCDRNDIFYVGDGPGSDAPDFELTADDVSRHVEALPARSRNAGMFYPWIEVPDPVGIGRDPRRFLPPSGHMCGVIARTDATRGVWKAPAGVEAVVTGSVGLQHELVDADQDLLNPKGLNCIRQLPAAGIVAWGSRTLASESDPESRYLPVRRTALFLKKSLRRGLEWAVFEPNDEDLWAQITLNVTAFMLGLFRQGAFQGATPAEAFIVQCDRETNPQELVDQGIVTTRVAFAPLKPAEFVVVVLQQKTQVPT